jgi:hypothetical protein
VLDCTPFYYWWSRTTGWTLLKYFAGFCNRGLLKICGTDFVSVHVPLFRYLDCHCTRKRKNFKHLSWYTARKLTQDLTHLTTIWEVPSSNFGGENRVPIDGFRGFYSFFQDTFRDGFPNETTTSPFHSSIIHCSPSSHSTIYKVYTKEWCNFKS